MNSYTDIHESLEGSTAHELLSDSSSSNSTAAAEKTTVGNDSGSQAAQLPAAGQERWFTRLPPVLFLELSRWGQNVIKVQFLLNLTLITHHSAKVPLGLFMNPLFMILNLCSSGFITTLRRKWLKRFTVALTFLSPSTWTVTWGPTSQSPAPNGKKSGPSKNDRLSWKTSCRNLPTTLAAVNKPLTPSRQRVSCLFQRSYNWQWTL